MDNEQELINDTCDEEGGEIMPVTRVYEVGGELLLIRNIPMISCNNGEDYFTAQTMREIERIKLHGDAMAERRLVLVADFPTNSPETSSVSAAEPTHTLEPATT